MSKYNFRMTKNINYNEDKYFDDLDVKEMVKLDKKLDKKLYKLEKNFDEKYKQELIKKIRGRMRIVDIVPIDVKPIIIISMINLSMEYVRNIGDSENFRLNLKDKIDEFRNEKKMTKYKKKLNNYYFELDSMMECD